MGHWIMIGDKWPLFMGLWLIFAGAVCAQTPPSEVPKGSIIGFLPDSRSADYTDMASLRHWLKRQGWAICDGSDGTPDLHGRYLLGTEEFKDTGQRIGSKTHSHQVSVNTGREEGRMRRFNTGIGYSLRLPTEGHRHSIKAKTSQEDDLPLSMRVLFIIKID